MMHVIREDSDWENMLVSFRCNGASVNLILVALGALEQTILGLLYFSTLPICCSFIVKMPSRILSLHV